MHESTLTLKRVPRQSTRACSWKAATPTVVRHRRPPPTVNIRRESRGLTSALSDGRLRRARPRCAELAHARACAPVARASKTEGTTLTSALADAVRPVHRAARRVSSSNVGHLRRSTPTGAPWVHVHSRTLGALRRSSPTRGPWLPRCAQLAAHANSRISTFRGICSSENKTPRVLPKIGARRHPRIEHHFLYEISLEMSIFVKKIGVV